MKTRMILSLGLSAFVFGGTMVGCTAGHGGLASAGSHEAAASAKLAARDADRAGRALAKGQALESVALAERAVAAMPQNAGYRALLGRGYLKAGRFASARAAFADSLSLAPEDGRTALNLALSQVALGDWQAARATLAAHDSAIPAADRGLALALAGDPAAGATMLNDVVRSGGGTPKIRQNLALALALAGQWPAARIVASADMSPADVDRRMEQWAAFAKPAAASDQVAALLGIAAAQDPGQPIALALVAPVSPGQTPVETVAAASTAPVPAAPAAATDPEALVAALPAAPATATDIRLAQQAMAPLPVARPAGLLRADAGAIKVAMTRAAAPARAKGNYFVQLGAFRTAAVLREGWRSATHRMPALARHTPTSARFAYRGGAVYRLAFGGLVRQEADGLCRRYRATGGACFVRTGAGDRMAYWAAKPVQLASR